MNDWEALLADHGPAMYRIAYRILGQTADAEDCVQDVFLELIAGSNRRQVCTPPAFLCWMVTVRSLDRLRKQRHASLGNFEVSATAFGNSEDPLQNSEMIEWLRRAVAQLPRRRSEVLSLRYFACMTYEQIAAVLDLDTNTVGVTLRDARKQLREWVPAIWENS